MTFDFKEDGDPRFRRSHEFIIAHGKIICVDEWQGNYSGGTIWRENATNNLELEQALAHAQKWDAVKYQEMMKEIKE